MGVDRLGDHFSIKLFRSSRGYLFGFGLVRGRWGWAGSLHVNLKTVWLRPIDYSAADRAGPYVRSKNHMVNRAKHLRAAVNDFCQAVYRGTQLKGPPQ